MNAKTKMKMVADGLEALACLHTARAMRTYNSGTFVRSTHAAKDALDLAAQVRKQGAKALQ